MFVLCSRILDLAGGDYLTSRAFVGILRSTGEGLSKQQGIRRHFEVTGRGYQTRIASLGSTGMDYLSSRAFVGILGVGCEGLS